MKVRPAIGNP